MDDQRERKPVVLIHRYYAPDTPPYAHILSQIAARLAESHPVTVISGDIPYRAGTDLAAADHGSVEVIRVRLIPERQGTLLRKALNAPLFALKSAVAAGRRAQGGVIMAATTPPVVVALAAAVAARAVGAKFIYHNQDTYPEILPSYFEVPKPGLALRAIRAVDTATGRLSSRIVVLSEDMRDLWIQRGVPADRLAIINNFVASSFHGDVPASTPNVGHDVKRLNVVYVGNIGPLQDLSAVLPLFATQPSVDVHVYGDGRDLARVQEAAAEGRATVHGAIPSAQVPEVLASADLGLVTLVDGVERAAYPSKILSLLTMGVPLLAFVAPDSHLAAEIRDNRLGYVVAKGDGSALQEALQRHAGLSEEQREEMRRRCEAYAQRYSQQAVLPKWAALYDRVLFPTTQTAVTR